MKEGSPPEKQGVAGGHSPKVRGRRGGGGETPGEGRAATRNRLPGAPSQYRGRKGRGCITPGRGGGKRRCHFRAKGARRQGAAPSQDTGKGGQPIPSGAASLWVQPCPGYTSLLRFSPSLFLCVPNSPIHRISRNFLRSSEFPQTLSRPIILRFSSPCPSAAKWRFTGILPTLLHLIDDRWF